MTEARENWTSGSPYERYVGRWSRLVADELLEWLAPPTGLAWGDIGCGTGALAGRILARCAPSSVVGADRSEAFLAEARRAVADPRARFEQADAAALPWAAGSLDATVSGLVLNFVADPAAAAREMARVTAPGGLVAAYVWDYAAGMQMMRRFWDAAVEVSPGDRALDQAERFPLCQPGPLAVLFEGAGLRAVEARAIEVPTHFRDFEDYWGPFLGGQGAAPTYLAGLDEGRRAAIRELLRGRLAPAGGPIALTARAWAVRGRAGA